MSATIISNANGAVHLAVQRELRGCVSGAVYRTYHVAACSYRVPGGSYGAHVLEQDASAITCAKCAKRAAKGAA